MSTRLLISLLLFFKVGYSQTIYIPVVVHVVYHESSQDMSDEEVQNLIASINLNFAGLSPNNAFTREVFDTIQADTEVQFCLALTDTSGMPCTGITHTYINNNLVPGAFEETKTYAAAWNTDRYLNIWIGSQGSESWSMGGVGSTPLTGGQPPYGVVVNRDFGSSIFVNLLTHEIGHYVGLDHIFDFDGVDDTPHTSYGGIGYYTCLVDSTTIGHNTYNDAPSPYWGNFDPPDMFENFMCYYFPCQKMFTKGQKEKMRNYIINNLSTLVNNDATCYSPDNYLVYPNPCYEDLNVKGIPDPTSFRIIDCFGKLVRAETITRNTINISELNAGIYSVMLLDKEQKSLAVKKVVKL